MRRVTDAIDAVETMFSQANRRGIAFKSFEDETIDGRLFHSNNQELINFGSCSYLGLEMEEGIKEGAAEALWRYGTQFSSSRAYLSLPLYGELEELLGELFGGEVLVTPTTTLGHLTALPVLLQEKDVLILDQQVHHSVQLAANQARVQGTGIEMVRHNRMDLLEKRLEELCRKHRQVWYLADGVYSMFGDLAPLEALTGLLERFDNFHLYLDDAHGMSWSGRNGRGYVLGNIPLHPKMVVATSLNKAFAAGGGALIFPQEAMKRRVRYCGGPMTFSGPLQPPMLGAAVASAKFHLSGAVHPLQEALRERIALCNRLLEAHQLPVVSPSEAPIRYIGVGLPRIAHNLAHRLMDDGFFPNVANFPAVMMNRAGIRFTLTCHQRMEDIERFVASLSRNLPLALAEEGSSMEEIHKAFARAIPGSQSPKPRVEVPAGLRLQHERSIEALDPAEWDRLLGKNGTFSWKGLAFLEGLFYDNQEEENNWDFHYYLVRDAAGRAILATFFTTALWKDDMLSPEATSYLVEQRRQKDPRFLTSLTHGMGSLLTEGNHLYLDRSGPWREAMLLLLGAIREEREHCEATRLVLRDLPSDDPEMDEFLLEQGFNKYSMPESLAIEVSWEDEEGFLRQLSKYSRRHQKREVLAWAPSFELEVLKKGDRTVSEEELDFLYSLYLNVKARGYLINTFDLPRRMFEKMLEREEWEILLLYIKPECGGPLERRPIGFLASFIGPEQYVPLLIGLDYGYVFSHHTYRQFLYRAVMRATEHGSKRIYFGFGATLEKQRLGAKIHEPSSYVQLYEHYNMEVLAQLMADAARVRV
ncbi:MAG: aminotransferase class I/II-fold pyridoxal phosphate-dependent enzyme [Bacteroidota bacterium]